jgi:hypothetical protein
VAAAVFSLHIYAVSYNEVLSDLVVVTVQSDTDFDRAVLMQVFKVQVCGGDWHPRLLSGILERQVLSSVTSNNHGNSAAGVGRCTRMFYYTVIDYTKV